MRLIDFIWVALVGLIFALVFLLIEFSKMHLAIRKIDKFIKQEKYK